MNMLRSSLLKDITEMYYQSEFKIFEVNSDGKMLEPSFDNPLGYFISLGITTSFSSLDKLAEIIQNSDYNFNTKIIELKSEKLSDGSYINSISSEDYHKFESPYDPKQVITKVGEESYTTADDIEHKYPSEKFKITVLDLAERISTIITGGWDTHKILILGDCEGATIFYNLVNYEKREDGTEYRVGIYVTED